MDQMNVVALRRADAGLPACTCDGSGWSFDGTPGPDGRPTVRRCQGCASTRVVRQFGEVRTWGQWKARPELGAAVASLRTFAETWARDRIWACLLHAPNGQANFGTGKTHACQAVAHDFVAQGLGVRYTAVPDHLEALRAAFGDDSIRVSDLAEFDGLVILDDLGLEKCTEWTQEQIEQLGDWRYRHRLPSLIASNLDKRALEARYPRFVDRCHEGLVISWGASSWRRR